MLQKLRLKYWGKHFVVIAMLCGISIIFIYPGSMQQASASLNDSTGLVVGTTYYGGHFDDAKGQWVIDNKNQCDRIKAGEFSAASLSAVMDTNCDDDNGLGYIGSIPLHNTVSFAELSTDYTNPNWAALGGLAAGTKLEINYNGRCVIAEKRDVGQGGTPVNGYHRSLDLWWQTARSLGFANGFDTMTIKLANQGLPLSPLGGTSPCSTSSTPVAAAQVQNSPTDTNAPQTTNNTVATANNTKENNETTKSKKPDIKPISNPDETLIVSEDGTVLSTSTPTPLSSSSTLPNSKNYLYIVALTLVLGGIGFAAWQTHKWI